MEITAQTHRNFQQFNAIDRFALFLCNRDRNLVSKSELLAQIPKGITLQAWEIFPHD